MNAHARVQQEREEISNGDIGKRAKEFFPPIGNLDSLIMTIAELMRDL